MGRPSTRWKTDLVWTRLWVWCSVITPVFLLVAMNPAAADDTARKRAMARFEQGEAYMNAGVYDKAAEEYRAAYALVPTAHGFLFNIGLALEKDGDAKGAIEHYAEYIERDPTGRKIAEARARKVALERELAAQSQVVPDRLTLDPDPAPPPDPPPSTANDDRRWLYYGIAGLVVAGGVLIDVVPGSASNGKLDVLDFVPAGMYLGAGALVFVATF